MEAAVRSDNAHERALAHGLVQSLLNDQKETWAAALFAKAKEESWGETALLTILSALPCKRWTWEQVAEAGPEIEASYWGHGGHSTPFQLDPDTDDFTFAIKKLISVSRARYAIRLGFLGKDHLSSDLLVELLRQVAQQPNTNDGDGIMASRLTYQYHVTEILNHLDQRQDINKQDLMELEWIYLPVLDHARRPAKLLLQGLSEDPAFFMQVLSTVFKASEDSGVRDVEPENTEQARDIASHAFQLLQNWNRIPGTRDDGTIDPKILEDWIKHARSLAKEKGREVIADHRIGNMLSASPFGLDGNWPAEAVREVIDLFSSKDMIKGFRSGKYNRPGVTVRKWGDGGQLERQEAANFCQWAKAIVDHHPQTARVLESLAQELELNASSLDEEVERLDWE